MNKYVVGFFSNFKGELKLELIEAESAFEAAVFFLGYSSEDLGPINTLEELQEQLFNLEDSIEVLDLNKALKTNWGGGRLQNGIAQFDSESRFQ